MVNCSECKFGEPVYCKTKKVFVDDRGNNVKEESQGGQMEIVCRPPGTRSGFVYRNQVAPLGYCDQGERRG